MSAFTARNWLSYVARMEGARVDTSLRNCWSSALASDSTGDFRAENFAADAISSSLPALAALCSLVAVAGEVAGFEAGVTEAGVVEEGAFAEISEPPVATGDDAGACTLATGGAGL